MSTTAFQSIFDLLKENKEFPNYHAERRIDIFVNYFLSRIITAFLNEEASYVCPEFPLKKSDTNQSTKLDYLCKTKAQPIFVELKTDLNSLKESQALNYLNSNWQTCISELAHIRKASKKVYRTKYDKLINLVNGLKFSNEIPAIRVIYISPINNKMKKVWKNVEILEQIELSALKPELRDDEKLLWEFVQKLELFIFEIIRK